MDAMMNDGSLNPIWVRIPARGKLEGFSRSMIYNLIAAGVIKSASIKQPGKLTGIRLVHISSLRAYIEKHVAPEQPAAAGE